MSEVKNILDTFNKYKKIIEYVVECEHFGNLNITKDEFLEVAPFLRIGGTVRNFIYSHRDDKEFIKATAKYHRNVNYFKDDIELYENILGTSNIEHLVDGFRNADAMYLFLLKTNNKDPNMFKINWLNNNHIDSFSKYLELDNTLDNKKKLNYSKNNYIDNDTGRATYLTYLLMDYLESDSKSKDELKHIIDLTSLEFNVNPSDAVKEALRQLKEASGYLLSRTQNIFLSILKLFIK